MNYSVSLRNNWKVWYLSKLKFSQTQTAELTDLCLIVVVQTLACTSHLTRVFGCGPGPGPIINNLIYWAIWEYHRSSQGVKVGGNAWERCSQALQICSPAFPGPKESLLYWERTFLGPQVRPVSTAECEHGFRRMNLVCSSLRSPLSVKHLSSLLSIALSGSPLALWKPLPFVKFVHELTCRVRTLNLTQSTHFPDLAGSQQTLHIAHPKCKFSRVRILIVCCHCGMQFDWFSTAKLTDRLCE